MKTTKIISGIMSLALVFGIAIPLADGTFSNSNVLTANAALNNNYIKQNYKIPEWYDIDLNYPVWQSMDLKSKDADYGFDERFKVDEFFPDDEFINDEKYKDYKCAATIIHPSRVSGVTGIYHVMVPKDTTELDAFVNNNGFSFYSKRTRDIIYIYRQQWHNKKKNEMKNPKWRVGRPESSRGSDRIYSNLPINIYNAKRTNLIQRKTPYFPYGDISGDGNIDITDAATLSAYLLYNSKLSPRDLKAADVNHDGVIDETDRDIIWDHIRGIKPISQDATTTTASTASSTTVSDASTIVETGTEVIEPVWKPAERFESFDFDEYKALLDEDVKNYPIRKDESIEQAYVEVMMKQVNNSHCCDQVPDEEWEKFCLLFNEKVKELYYENPYNFTPEIHYFRNRLNRAPETLNGLLKENAEYYRKHGINKWKMMDAWASSYHMFNTRACNNEGVFNLKFVSENGLYEAVYDKMGYSLNETDPINMGTYNYGDPSNMLDHMYMDVFPYTNQSYDSIISGFNIIQSITTKNPITSITISGIISEELLTGKIICRGWLNTPDSDHFECSDMINNYESFLSDNAAQERRAKYESMLNNHEYIGEDGEIRR